MKLPTGNPKKEKLASIKKRVFVCIIIALIVGSITGLVVSWQYAPLAAWDSGVLVFLMWLWLALRGRDAEETASLATREDPGHAATDILLIFSSVASLGAVLAILLKAGQSSGMEELFLTIFAIASIVISWTLVHTLYMLRYARMFYKLKEGIDFNSDSPPCYSDFAYVAFTIGMTFQISDNSFTHTDFRRIALKHALLSYVFGTAIVAATINVIAGLAK